MRSNARYSKAATDQVAAKQCYIFKSILCKQRIKLSAPVQLFDPLLEGGRPNE